jgi:hypothetical protein
MKKIVCLWGASGTGKSTTAAGIYSKLKKLGYSCELSREVVKEWVYQGRNLALGDQMLIVSTQIKNEFAYVKNELDFIISDNPVLETVMYAEQLDKLDYKLSITKNLANYYENHCESKGYTFKHYLLDNNIDNDNIVNFLVNSKIKFKELIIDESTEDNIINDLIGDKNVSEL